LKETKRETTVTPESLLLAAEVIFDGCLRRLCKEFAYDRKWFEIVRRDGELWLRAKVLGEIQVNILEVGEIVATYADAERVLFPTFARNEWKLAKLR
jgi:hypothetical protein